MARWGFLVILAALLCGCITNLKPPAESELRVGGHYAQCDGRANGGSDNADSVRAIIRTHVPGGNHVNCTDRLTFTNDGKEIDFVFVAFGPIGDCPAGCFSQSLCAIYDSPDVLLYAQAGQASTPGMDHPITRSDDFVSFRDIQQRAGAWRSCFPRLRANK